MASTYIGQSIRRREDPRLLRGQGRFVADMALKDSLAVVFVRSPHARARIRSVDRGRAGAFAVVTAEDIRGRVGPVPMWGLPPDHLKDHTTFLSYQHVDQPALADGEVRYVGEPVAAVLAENRYLAEDAAERVAVDYEPLPAVVDPEKALERDSPRVHGGWESNLAVRIVAEKGDPDGAFSGADCVVSGRYRSSRLICMSLEARGVLAQYDDRTGQLTVWSSTQFPFEVRALVAQALGIPDTRLRVVAPDVGGGFGGKAVVYPEEVLLPHLAMRFGRPVQWVGDRREDLATTIQSRDQAHEIELAVRRDGTILGMRDRFVLDTGAYNPTCTITPYNSIAHLQGPYRIPNLRAEARVAVTDKVPNAPYRGAGRPESVFAAERILDRAARAIGMDPVEFRRRNLVPAGEMPYDAGLYYRDGFPLLYDSGDYPGALQQAVDALGGLAAFRERQGRARAEGRHLGMGVALYVEGTGIGPYEGATVTVDAHGTVTVGTGSSAHGQGHQTSFAQICADALGVPIERVRIMGGDTSTTPFGIGTFASRSIVCGGGAVAEAAGKVRRKAVQAAARLLEARPEDVELRDGELRPRGVPGRSLDLGRLAGLLTPEKPLAREFEPGLSASAWFSPETVTYASACHAAVVEVDTATGEVRPLEYVVVHDCGRLVNPVIVHGQVIGGFAQGLGAALLEEVRFDPETGQLQTGSLMDYLVPSADGLPPCGLVHQETVSPRNALGVKGVGEGGAIAPPAAIANAVEDALSPFGVEVETCPVTPERVREALVRAAAR